MRRHSGFRFLSTPSARRATLGGNRRIHDASEFLSTPSARRATSQVCKHRVVVRISIHALREEGDYMATAGEESWMKFLSTPSARRATGSPVPAQPDNRYFYPRPPRGGRLKVVPEQSCRHEISIHALREEGDTQNDGTQKSQRISIHALREEGDTQNDGTQKSQRISIHALREEGDMVFYVSSDSFPISIHALREEGDEPGIRAGPSDRHFYPRPPRGGRPNFCRISSGS